MTDKERLEELEDLFEDISNDMMPPYAGITLDTVADVKWVIQYAKEQAERVQELEEDKKALGDLIEKVAKKAWDIEQQNKRYREAREIIEQVYKENYVKDAYGYEDGYLDGLDTAMSIIDEAEEESK